jgi:hypothetical protein
MLAYRVAPSLPLVIVNGRAPQLWPSTSPGLAVVVIRCLTMPPERTAKCRSGDGAALPVSTVAQPHQLPIVGAPSYRGTLAESVSAVVPVIVAGSTELAGVACVTRIAP